MGFRGYQRVEVDDTHVPKGGLDRDAAGTNHVVAPHRNDLAQAIQRTEVRGERGALALLLAFVILAATGATARDGATVDHPVSVAAALSVRSSDREIAAELRGAEALGLDALALRQTAALPRWRRIEERGLPPIRAPA